MVAGMTRDEIIGMARDAGFEQDEKWEDDFHCNTAMIERFAELVAAAEREECAKICSNIHETEGFYSNGQAEECADAIRERGKA